MEITHKGDKDFDPIPSVKSKALRINLNENIYSLDFKPKQVLRRFIASSISDNPLT